MIVKKSQLLNIFIAAVLLCGGCSTPPAVKTLSKHNIETSKRLADEQKKVFADYGAFVTESEKVTRKFAEAWRNEKFAYLDVRHEKLLVYADAKEASVIKEFDDRADDLLSTEFETRIEEFFTGPIRDKSEALKATVASLSQSARGSPNDAQAQSNFRQRQLEYYYLRSLAGEEESRIRQYANKQLSDLRAVFAAKVQKRFAEERSAIEKQIGEARKKVLAEDPSDSPAFKVFAERQASIAEMEKALANAFQAHESGLQQIDTYLNRPSELQLLLAGAWEGIREVAGEELKKLPFGDDLSLAADNLLGGVGQSLSTTVDNLTQRGEDMLQNWMNNVTSRVKTSATNLKKDNASNKE